MVLGCVTFFDGAAGSCYETERKCGARYENERFLKIEGDFEAPAGVQYRPSRIAAARAARAFTSAGHMLSKASSMSMKYSAIAR